VSNVLAVRSGRHQSRAGTGFSVEESIEFVPIALDVDVLASTCCQEPINLCWKGLVGLGILELAHRVACLCRQKVYELTNPAWFGFPTLLCVIGELISWKLSSRTSRASFDRQQLRHQCSRAGYSGCGPSLRAHGCSPTYNV
jgi:hypothetical protein